ncbi:putative reverse transcriptase zinc-binding domain-containing protein [Helianthus annuus]|nr:putative reverse transcriptase zinc-binding domain-containing protein [Helianthus annuus]
MVGDNRVIYWQWIRVPSSAEELAEKSSLEALLQSASLGGSEDSWMWTAGSANSFEVAGVKRWLRGSPVSDSAFVFSWSSWVPNKCNIFMWRAFLDRLPTKVALVRRNIAIENQLCVWCGTYDESIEHVLTGCVTSMGVWSAIATCCKIPRPFVFHVKDLVDLHDQSGVLGVKKTLLHGIIIITCWRLWRARNEKLFNSKNSNVVEMVADIKSLGFLWYKHRFKEGVVDWRRWCLFDVM